jgi:preprotein translocase subunit SecA
VSTAVLRLPVRDPAPGPYPERGDRDEPVLDRWARVLAAGLDRRLRPARGRLARLAAGAAGAADTLAGLSDAALRARLAQVAVPAVRDLDPRAQALGLAAVAEAARRTLGVAPYPTQLMGAAVLLAGRLAEMQTGEGKTLTAGLAACLAGAAGLPVHVVTVNDYLAGRDAAELAPLYAFFGLTVGTVLAGTDPAARRAAYRRDIAYCTNKELVFDYLRDRVAAGARASLAQVRVKALLAGRGEPLLLRGLHFAIVDEADSILIDEARTPLILSQQAGERPDPALFRHALDLAEGLEQGRDYRIDAARRTLALTPAGRARLRTETAGLAGPLRAAQTREHLVAQALRARHLFHRDRHYLVADDKVQIVDEYTGRVLAGRTWEQGLHQAIETKEGCPLSAPTLTLARITYQRFFHRYLRLAGMTGTAREVAGELLAVYGLATVALPTHRPCIRRRLPPLLCPDQAAKWQRVAAEAAELAVRGRPVLIGTRSVEASERAAAALAVHGLAHRVLNARQDAGEAQTIAAAGAPGQITVATNMAGRGTDIRLAPGVAAGGGLHVILTELHEAARIDRQLVGRAARQGDPGSCRAILALDDPLFRAQGGIPAALLRALGSAGVPLGRLVLGPLGRACQHRAERIHARTRRDTLRQDRRLDRLLAFAGSDL